MFSSAKERNLLDKTYEQSTELLKLLSSDATLVKFLTAPQVPTEQKESLIRKVFGETLEDIFVEFLVVILKKRRAGFLPEIIEEFIELVEEAKGISRATAITAVPMSEQQGEKLRASLAARSGKKIFIEYKTDPNILGGLIVMVDGEIIDGSIRRGLNMIEEKLNKIRVH